MVCSPVISGNNHGERGWGVGSGWWVQCSWHAVLFTLSQPVIVPRSNSHSWWLKCQRERIKQGILLGMKESFLSFVQRLTFLQKASILCIIQSDVCNLSFKSKNMIAACHYMTIC